MVTRSRTVLRSSLVVVAALAVVPLATTRARAQQESSGSTLHPDDAPSSSASTSVGPTTGASASSAPVIVIEGEGNTSPAWTQSRTFTTTRFWRLDKGQQEFEIWYSSRLKKDGTGNDGTPAINRHLMQVEYMVSLIQGLQLDVYMNWQYEKTENLHYQGTQVELRIAPWSYGSIFGNPVLYLEWLSQYQDANRGEARLLFGGQLGHPQLRGAFNLLFEQNIDSPNGKKADFVPDREMGATAAVAYEVVPRTLAFGAEGRVLLDQQGNPPDAAGNPTYDYYKVAKVGPMMWLSVAESHFHLTAAVMFGLTKHSDVFNPLLILGYRP